MNEKLLVVLTIICQLAIITIIVFNIVILYDKTIIVNIFRDIVSFVYLFIYFIYLNLCDYYDNTIINNGKTTNNENNISVNDNNKNIPRISTIKQMVTGVDKKLIFIFIPILLTLININAICRHSDHYDSVDSDDDDSVDSNHECCLNNNWTIIILVILIIFLNILNFLKLFKISEIIPTINLDYFTLGVFLIFIIQNIFLDDIKTYILLSVFIVYPLIDSFIILSKTPNSQPINAMKIIGDYPMYNNFLTSIPVVSLGVIMLIMKFFKDCTEFTLVIGTVFLSLIALYHIISTLYIFNRHILTIPYISKYINKFKDMMIICLKES